MCFRRSKLNVCHNCGWHGEIHGFLRKLLGVSNDRIEEILGQKHYRRRKVEPEVQETVVEYPSKFRFLENAREGFNAPYWKYLMKKRDLGPSTITEYQMGFCPLGKYAGRVVVPVFWHDELVNWIARDIG